MKNGKHIKLLMLALLVFGSFVFADDSKVSGEESRKAEYKAYEGTIPLPRQLSYAGKGLGIGLGLGMIQPLGGNDNTLLAWRGAGEYYYKPYLSGGLEIMIYGGDIADEVMLLYSRYRLHARFHYQPLKNVDVFAAPLVWFESTNIDDIRYEMDYEDSTGYFYSSIYDDAPEQNGFAVGGEAGAGIRLPWNLGVFAEGVWEHSFSGKNVFATTAGIGYDIRGVSDFFKRNAYAMWLSLEATFRRYAEENWDGTGQFYFLSLHLAL